MLTTTVTSTSYATEISNGKWQYEYILGVASWHPSRNSQHRGNLSNMTSAEFAEEYASVYSGTTVTEEGAAAFAAAAALVWAIEVPVFFVLRLFFGEIIIILLLLLLLISQRCASPHAPHVVHTPIGC